MNHPSTIQIHATCVMLAGIGVLLRGEPGAGKSDVAIRLIDGGAQLVADDRVGLSAVGGVLVARAPAAIAGWMEVRGVGIVEVPAVPEAEVGLVVDLVSPGSIERLPGPRYCYYLGIALPLLELAPFQPSAIAKLRLVAREAAAGRLFADLISPAAL